MIPRPRRPARGGPAVSAAPPPPATTRPDRRGLAVVALLVVLEIAALFATCIVKYRYYLYRDFDLAIFTQATSQILRGSLYSSIRGMSWLGDHSSLILFAVAPLFALVRHPLTLVFLGTVALALGAFPLHALARREGLRESSAVALAALYLLHPAIGYANLYEFHPEQLATSALIAAFFFLRDARVRPMLVWTAVALLCKEDVALVVLAMAAYALTLRRGRRLAFALPLAALAGLSLVVSFAVLKPMFNQGESAYARMYESWGGSPMQMLGTMLTHPIAVAASFLWTPGDRGDTAVKLLDHVQMLLPVMGLPLLSPLVLLTALPIGIEHFLSSRFQQHTIVFQYTALVMPSVAVASVLGFRCLAGWRVRGAALPAARERLLAGTALACSIASNLMFGPLLGHGVMLRVPAPETVRPSGYDRALAPLRDRFARAVPGGGGVVAGFEMLPRFSDRSEVYSLHHVLLGRYTFSNRPFVPPTGVAAVIADLSDGNLTPYVQPGSSERLASLLASNQLAPSAAAGDLVLFAKHVARPLALVEYGAFAPRFPESVDFDGSIAYLGCNPIQARSHPGAALAVDTYWRRTGPVDRVYLMNLVLLDAGGVVRAGRSRVLGYAVWAPEAWPMMPMVVREQTGIVLPVDLAPGTYTVCFDLGWRVGSRRGQAESDLVSGARDPRMRLGTIEVRQPGSAAR